MATAGSGSDDDSDQLMSIHEAARNCNVRQLRRALAAGAYPDFAISERQRMRRVYPVLLAAGAALPTEASDPYLQRVIAAGSFANYARNHLVTLTEMLTPRRGPSSPLRLVPPEVLRKIAAFAFHVGYY